MPAYFNVALYDNRKNALTALGEQVPHNAPFSRSVDLTLARQTAKAIGWMMCLCETSFLSATSTTIHSISP